MDQWTRVRGAGTLVFAILFAVLGSSSMSRADPPPCDQVCYYDTPCWWECLPDPHEPWMSTCGDWGRCEGDCQPEWQRVSGSEHRIGRRYGVDVPFSFYNCHDIVAYTLRDVSACGWGAETEGCEEQDYAVAWPSDCPNQGTEHCW